MGKSRSIHRDGNQHILHQVHGRPTCNDVYETKGAQVQARVEEAELKAWANLATAGAAEGERRGKRRREDEEDEEGGPCNLKMLYTRTLR